MSETHLSPFFDPQSLLAESGWIRGLARRLVADEALADDLVQDTWLEALARRPETGRSLRGWLATVMRHNLAKLRRGERHRRGREEGRSRDEREPSTLDVVERAATHRDVVLALMELEEPYRRTLLLRFFDQSSYQAIAAQEGITQAAVNSRVTRGLERLRQRLERRYGDRRALALALVSLADPPVGSVPFTLPKGAPVQVALASAAVLAATVTVTTVLGPGPSDPVAPQAGPGAELSSLALAELPLALETPLPLQERRVVDPPQRTAVQQEQEKPAPWTAELLRSLPVSETWKRIGANVGAGDLTVETAAGGSLEIEAHIRADLEKADPRYLTQVFEDHVTLLEQKGMLMIEETEHRKGITVSLVLRIPGELPIMLNTGAGDVLVRHATADINANTGAGDVHVDLPQADPKKLNLNTGAGDVLVDVRRVDGQVVANSGAGDVIGRLRDGASQGKFSLNSGAGAVLLVVPPNVGGTLVAASHDSLDLPAELGMVIEEKADGGLEARATFGVGGTFSANSGNGKVSIKLLGAGEPLPAPATQDR